MERILQQNAFYKTLALRLGLFALAFFGSVVVMFGQGTQILTTGSGNFTVPAGVEALSITVKGAGGGGSYDSLGAGGGAVAFKAIFLTSPGTNIPYLVGSKGSGGTAVLNNGTDGGFSSFGGGVLDTLTAGGGLSGGNGGNGGIATGDGTNFNGGNGALASYTTNQTGGGGSSADSLTIGNNAADSLGAAGPTYGYKGGNGGASPGLIGNPGEGFGAGGGGGFDAVGGDGGDGQIVITWTCPSVTSLSYTSANFCKSLVSELPTINGTLGGAFSFTGPGALTLDVLTGEINPSSSDPGIYIITYGFNAETGNTSNCPESKETFEVTINALPVISGSYEVCIGKTTVAISFTSDPAGPAAVLPWVSFRPDSATVNDLGRVSGILAGPTLIIYTDDKGCHDTTSVTVNPIPTSVDANNNSPVCFGTNLELTSDPDGLTTYDWVGPAAFHSSSQDTTLTNVTFANNGIYSVTLTNAFGCSTSATTSVKVNASKLYVNDNASGLNDGTSWANAFTSLDSALTYIKCAVDTVWVAGGQYFPSLDPLGNATPTDNRNKTFYLKSGQKIFGGFAGTETSLTQRTNAVINANPSILSGNVNGSYNTNDDVYHVVMSINDNNETILNGFTITNGNATGFGNLEVDTKIIKKNTGAGLYTVASLIKIQTCKFEINTASNAGAIYNERSDIELNNCFFSQNSAINAGAIYNVKSSPQIVNSAFLNNSANLGGAVYNTDTSIAVFNNCSFANNGANINGGAILNENRSDASIQNTTFSNNTASSFGGAISNINHSSPTVDSCTFTANNANYGGAIYNIDSSDAQITACQFYSNTAPNKGGGVYSENNSRALISECLFSGNSSNSGAGVYSFNTALGGSPEITHSSFINNVGGFGGAIANFGSSPNINNLILNGNSASSIGGGIYNSNSSNPLITNITFRNNTSVNGGGGIYNSSSSWPKVRNSIFSGNKKGNSTSVRGADIENNGTTTKVTLGNSLVQNLNSASFYPLTDTSGFLGGGKSNYYNIDPQFINSSDPDGIDNIFGTIDDGLQLKDCSPAINTGDNANITTTDIAGQVRLSTGTTNVDMGAFENQTETTPVTFAISQVGAFCYGTSISFTALPASAGTYKFMVNGEQRQSNTANIFSIDTLKNGDYISVHLEAANCELSGNSDYMTVEVYDLPKPIIIGDTVCSDLDINLFASNSNSTSGNTYEWTGPAFQPSSAAQNPVISNSLVSYSGKYYVTITDANSCVKNDSVNVLVRPLPILSITGGSTFCEDQISPDLSITLQGSGPWDFSYSDGTDTTNVSNRSTSPYTITRAPAGSYTVISANDIYCNASAATLIGTADVIINPIPPVPVITEPAEKIVCFENTLTLEVTNCTGTVTWYNNNIETTTTANPLILDSVGTYSLSAKCTALGCVSAVSGLTADLEIKTKPSAPVLQLVSSAIVCSPDSLLFSGSCSLGNLIWLDNSSTVANRKIKAVGVYNISAICSFNDCISNESTLTSLTIKEKPSAPVISVPNEIVVCDPTTITLNSGCATGNILWNNVDSNTDLVLSGTGVYSAYSVCTLNGCVSDTTNNTGFEIKEKPAAPVLVIPATLIVCEPDSIIIKGSCAAGSTIRWNNASTLDSVILKIADTYAIDATCVKNGCSSDASATVNAEIKSSGLPSITSNSPICQGASLNLSSSLADIYGWSGPTGILDSAQSITVVDAQAGMYYLTVTYANGCSRNDSTEVSFNAILTPPTISVPAQLVVCAPNTITLVASCTTGTVKWSDNVTAPATRVFSTPGTYTGISATCTLNECYSDPTNASNLEIKAAADFTVANNGPICTGAVLNLTSSLAGETYHWTGPSSFESFVQNPTSIPPVAGTYVLTVTYTNACTLTKSTQVTVKPKPSSPNVNIPASKITCEPNTISFSATCPAGTLKWIDNSTSPIIKLDTVNTYNISAICIFNGCPSNNSTNTVVEIKERPLTPVINPPAQSSACSPGGSLDIGATCANGSSLLWNNSTSVSPLVLSNTGSYSISALCLKNGCISPTSSPLALNIYQTPEAPVVTGPTNAVVCAPSTLQLSATCVSGTVKWSNDSTGTNLTLSAVNTYSISAKCVLNGCSSDASTPIAMEIRTAPVVSITNPASICAGATLSFTATEGASYSWQGSNGFTSNVRNPAILNAGVNRTGTYSVTVTFANSCSSSATTSVVVNSSPALSVTANPTTVESGASSTLTLSGCSGGTINWAINNSAVNPLTIAIFNTTDFSVSCIKNGCTSVISKKVTVSNPCESLLVLESLIDNISSSAGVLLKQASTNGGKIEASNKITGTAKVNYEAPSIELKSGFVSESGTVFTAQPGGCN